MRSGRTAPLSGLLYELSRYSNGPFAYARRYVDIWRRSASISKQAPVRAARTGRRTGGVVAYLLTTQSPSATPA